MELASSTAGTPCTARRGGSSFGYSASHGCVNLPVPVAKWVYDFAPIGTPVVTRR